MSESTENPKEIKNIETATWASLFRKRYIKCLLSAIFLAVGQQSSGVNTITMYATMSFGSFFEGNAYSSVYCNLIIDVVNMAAAVIPILLVEKAGRKTLEFVGFGGVAICLVVLTCIFNLMDQTSEVFKTLQMTATIVHLTFSNVGPGPIFSILTGELYPLHAASKFTAISFVCRGLTNIVVMYIFPVL